MANNSPRTDPIVLLVLGSSVLMGSGSVVFTLLPSMQDEVGFPTWGFGLIAGVFFAASLVAQLGLARYADRGHAKTLLIAAILLGIASLVWMAFGSSLTELTLARGLGGLAAGSWGPAARAMAIAKRPDRTATRLGYLAVGDTSGLVAGPLFGSFLAAQFSLRTAFLVFACLVLAITPVLFTSAVGTDVKPTDGAGNGGDGNTSSLTSLLADKSVRQAALLSMALFLPVGLYETVWGKHISNLGGSSYIIALSVALYGLPYMIVAPLGGRLGDRIGSVRVALIGSIGLVVITVVTGIPRNYWALLPLGVIEASISAIAYTNALAAMSRACSPQQQAAGQGLAGAASIGAAGVMAMIAGPLFAWGGPLVAFSSAAALVALGAFAAYLLDPSALNRQPSVERPLVEHEG